MSKKLNKIAAMYNAASAMSDTPKGKGSPEEMVESMKKKEAKEGPSGDEESESAEEQAAEDAAGVERHPAAAEAAKSKRSKKLDFTEGRGGLRTTIYKSK